MIVSLRLVYTCTAYICDLFQHGPLFVDMHVVTFACTCLVVYVWRTDNQDMGANIPCVVRLIAMGYSTREVQWSIRPGRFLAREGTLNTIHYYDMSITASLYVVETTLIMPSLYRCMCYGQIHVEPTVQLPKGHNNYYDGNVHRYATWLHKASFFTCAH